MSNRLRCLIALMLVASLPALAQQSSTSGYRYRWRDPQGLPHYSDSLSAEAIKYGYDLVDDRGITVRHVDRELTPEERAIAQKNAAAQAQAQREADQKARTEAQMLAAYPTEAAYKASLQQDLDNIDQRIDTTKINLRSQEKTLADLLSRASEAERAKQPVPKALSDSISQQRNVVAGQRAALARAQAERDATAQAMTAKLQRYHELKAAQSRDEAG